MNPLETKGQFFVQSYYTKRQSKLKGYPEVMSRLIKGLAGMPGIGRRSAERLAYHILNMSEKEALELATAIAELKRRLKPCSICFNLAEGETCPICQDGGRDTSVICVIEEPKDLWSIEKTSQYKGLYHVLQGHISPLEDVAPEDLTIKSLVERVKDGGIKEVVLATNFSVEGDATALYIQKSLEPLGVKITRLARGIPQGSYLEYLNGAVLAEAMAGRRTF
jgi:recombination protein RecR